MILGRSPRIQDERPLGELLAQAEARIEGLVRALREERERRIKAEAAMLEQTIVED